MSDGLLLRDVELRNVSSVQAISATLSVHTAATVRCHAVDCRLHVTVQVKWATHPLWQRPTDDLVLVLVDVDALVLGDVDALVLGDVDALVLGDVDALVLGDVDALVLADADALVLADVDALVLADVVIVSMEETRGIFDVQTVGPTFSVRTTTPENFDRTSLPFKS